MCANINMTANVGESQESVCKRERERESQRESNLIFGDQTQMV